MNMAMRDLSLRRDVLKARHSRVQSNNLVARIEIPRSLDSLTLASLVSCPLRSLRNMNLFTILASA
jgi:hypothetical protein